jgi:hypothetical protein
MGNVHGVEVTDPDRVLFPDEGITRGDVVEYDRWNRQARPLPAAWARLGSLTASRAS